MVEPNERSGHAIKAAQFFLTTHDRQRWRQDATVEVRGKLTIEQTVAAALNREPECNDEDPGEASE